LVGDVAVIFSRAALADRRLHETREGWQNVNWRIDTPVVELTVDEDLSLGDVARQVRDRMCDI
jgi:hypothetical protein